MKREFDFRQKKILLAALCILIGGVMLSCNLLTTITGSGDDIPDFDDIMLTNTQEAVYLRQTELAQPAVQIFLTQTEFAKNLPTSTATATKTPTATEFDSSILTATNSAAEKTTTNTPVVAPTFTRTPAPTNTVGPSPTP
ncbi:MAG: hypothetical protein V2J07_02330, partial [Anaerolineae bacterium]|nr:hypothetical protein [Anaerolineae bacterium]